VFAAPREARSLDLPEVALRDARIIALHEADWSGCLTIKHRIAPGLDM
jgi:hypothetical protein